MILVDANLLLYAYSPRSENHQTARSWLESTLSGNELVRFAWLTVWAFLRIATNKRVHDHPLSTEEATSIVNSWLNRPIVEILDPGERHWEILGHMMSEGQTTGPMIMDAVIAAIAIEHGATLQTTDRDFARFEGLKWTNPISARG